MSGLPGAGPAPRVLAGIFAGGRGLRMGGVDKGQLIAPDTGETLIARLLRLAGQVGLDAVIVGGEGRESGGVQRLADEPSGIGPLGGLSALLAHAGERPAIAIACDMPYVDAALLERLATCVSAAHVIAARDPSTRKWQPLFARYDAPRVLPVLRADIARGVRSFQAVLRALEVEELPLSASEHDKLRDWDEPSDLAR